MSAARRRDIGLTVLVFGGLLALWYLIALILDAKGDPAAIEKMPYPHLVLQRFIDYPGTLADATWTTVARALIGFAIGSAIGFVLSVVMVQARWLESSLMPYVLGAQMIPLVALVPIALTVLGDANKTRLFMAAYVSFFSVTVPSVRGLRSSPPEAIELLRSYNASRWKLLRYLTIPAALPYVFSGLRIAAPLSLVGAIIVDLMGAQQGLGYLMLSALTFGPEQATMLWAAMLITLALGFLLAQAVVFAERLLTPWQVSLRERDT